MSGPTANRAMRAGGLALLAAVLLAAGVLGIEWRTAPSVLRIPLVQVLLVDAGILVLFTALLTLALGRRTGQPTPSPSPSKSSPGPSLMTLPALLEEPSEAWPPAPASSPEAMTPRPEATIARPPSGAVAAGPVGSTLLIPFARETPPALPSAPGPIAGQTVSSLVDRMDALQRVAPSGSATVAPSAPTPERPTADSSLLLRLTQIPTPPIPSTSSAAVRRCNDCGEPLGSPPLFEPCSDCGRALCERCYWRASSGPEAHLCTSCLQERAIPPPVTPAVTFGRPSAVASGSVPPGRTLQPRRPVS